MKYDVALFVEDIAHEEFLKAFIHRLAIIENVDLEIIIYNNTRGHGAVVSELRRFLRDVEKGRLPSTHAIVIGIDANCKGWGQCLKDIKSEIGNIAVHAEIVYALPDPHVERWLMLDSEAFKKILGKGCSAPDHKCDRDRYKTLLSHAIRETGVVPLIGGIEYASDLVKEMNFEVGAKDDPAFKKLLQEMRRVLKAFKRNAKSTNVE